MNFIVNPKSSTTNAFCYGANMCKGKVKCNCNVKVKPQE